MEYSEDDELVLIDVLSNEDDDVDELWNEFKKQNPNAVIEVIDTTCHDRFAVETTPSPAISKIQLNSSDLLTEEGLSLPLSNEEANITQTDEGNPDHPFNSPLGLPSTSILHSPTPSLGTINIQLNSSDLLTEEGLSLPLSNEEANIIQTDEGNPDHPSSSPIGLPSTSIPHIPTPSSGTTNIQLNSSDLPTEERLSLPLSNADLNIIQTDEDNPDDPDYTPNCEEVDNTSLMGRMKRKRRKVAEPEEWRDNKNMKLREMGKSYEGWSAKKRGTGREERKMGKPCQSQFCLKSSTRQCHEVTEDERKILFETFWETLNWDQKRIYIISLLQYSEKNTTRKKPGEKSKRHGTVSYHLKCPNGKYVQVCKKLFLSTFNLGEWTVLNWISEDFKKGNNGMTPSKEVVLQQRRESNPRKSFRNIEGKELLKRFIESLPKLPSHYCRKNTSKIYLEPLYGDNMLGLFNEYKRLCKENEAGPVQHVSKCTFDKVISELNLSFQQPKKDRCDKCIMFEVGSLTEEQYKKHIEAKNRAREEKENDKKKAIEGSAIVLTMDVQAVKVCPSLNASALYYKTKLCCHNFTIYDLASHAVTCYWFNETQSDLSANTFASCVIDYLLDNNCDATKPIIIWSDGCTSQNRNKTLSNALLSYSTEKQVQIEQKFLVKGHTQMEVDCVHSLIERKLKNKSIYLPSDFSRITKESRCTPQPYRVKELNFEFTKNYGAKNLFVYDNIRPGKKPSDPKVTNIRAIKYSEGKIETKIGFDDTYKPLPHRTRRSCPPLSSFQQLFSAPLKIPMRKWQDLQELKSVIPSDCHLFYDHLPYNNND